MTATDWEGHYQRGETGWDRGNASPALAHWRETDSLSPCRILIPGSGYGHEAVELARLDFNVTAVDIADSPVRHLRQKLNELEIHADIVQADVLNWQPQQPFDAIYEQTCLCALNPEMWPEYEQQLHRWLKPGGSLFAQFMQTGNAGGPPHHCDLLKMRELFDGSRWQWPEDEQLLLVPHSGNRFELGFRLEHKA